MCEIEITEKESEIIDYLNELQQSLTADTLPILVYIAGYIKKKVKFHLMIHIVFMMIMKVFSILLTWAN